ncbi:MAG: hypothetical protein QM753_07195 [Thermomicrobiales bacterium]
MPTSSLLTGPLAGLAGGAAYLAVMRADLAVLGNNTDDLILLGGIFSRDPLTARRIGLLIHAGNSMAVGMVYAIVAARLSGPGWMRGVAFATAENVALYPIMRLIDAHPAIREGRLDAYWMWTAFGQAVVRHIAFGAVMGGVFERLRTGATAI